jgi:hypothetical protein
MVLVAHTTIAAGRLSPERKNKQGEKASSVSSPAFFTVLAFGSYLMIFGEFFLVFFLKIPDSAEATLPIAAFTIISDMMFQYIGKPKKSAVLALSCQGFAFIPDLLPLSRFFGFLV